MKLDSNETSMKWISYQISTSYNELYLFNRGNFRKGEREREREIERILKSSIQNVWNSKIVKNSCPALPLQCSRGMPALEMDTFWGWQLQNLLRFKVTSFANFNQQYLISHKMEDETCWEANLKDLYQKQPTLKAFARWLFR